MGPSLNSVPADTNPDAIASLVERDGYAIVEALAPELVEQPTGILPHPLQAYAGTYSSPVLGEVTFLLVDDRLEMTMGRMWSAVEVFDASRNALRVEPAGGGQVVTFDISEGADRARSLRFNQIDFLRVDRRD